MNNGWESERDKACHEVRSGSIPKTLLQIRELCESMQTDANRHAEDTLALKVVQMRLCLYCALLTGDRETYEKQLPMYSEALIEIMEFLRDTMSSAEYVEAWDRSRAEHDTLQLHYPKTFFNKLVT